MERESESRTGAGEKLMSMKTPGSVLLLLLLWSGLAAAAAESGGVQDEAAAAPSPLQACLSETHAALREMSALVAELRLAKEQLEKQIEELKKENEDNKVAFSASFSVVADKHIGPFKIDTTLVFDHVFTNVGNAYDFRKGVFKAPVKGVYRFDYHVFAGGDHGAGAKLEKNGQHVVAAYNHKAPHDINTSQGVSLLLEAGDALCLRLEAGWWVAAYTGHLTTFSGELLFPME